MLRIEGWDLGGRIFRGVSIERFCFCGSWIDCGRIRGCCLELYRGRGNWEFGSGIVSCWTIGIVRRRKRCWGESYKLLVIYVFKSDYMLYFRFLF